ncbi:MAG: prohibitin family protein [Nitrospirae bacterium]|nr:prohibitin family protein [Nitrospirota bacterium]
MKRLTLYHVVALAIPILLLMGGCGRTIDPGMRGLRWSPLSGGLEKESLKNGFYWRAPWNDVFEYDVRYQSFTEKIDALTADDLSVTLHVAITMSPIPDEIYFLAQEVGPNWYQQLVRPQFLSATRGVVAQYSMVTLPERSSEIGNKIEAVMVESLKGRHLSIYSVALSEIEFSKMVLQAIENKQAKEQEKEQKEFELIIAERNAEIARIQAKGEGDALRIRAEGEGESLRIRAMGQSKAQEIITKTLTPDYLKYKLYDSPNSKLVIVPDKSNVPIIVSPGSDQTR